MSSNNPQLTDEQLDQFIRDNFDNLTSGFKCPITDFIMYYPVVASDGNIYERDAIETWMESNFTSPLTREHLVNSFQDIPLYKQLIDTFVEKGLNIDPELKEVVYEPSFEFGDNITAIFNYLKNAQCGDLYKLREYKGYDLVYYHYSSYYGYKSFIALLLTKCTSVLTFTHILANCLEIGFANSADHNRGLVHYVFLYGHPPIVEYLVDNYERFHLDLLQETRVNGNKYTPIGLLIENENYQQLDNFITIVERMGQKMTLNLGEVFWSICAYKSNKVDLIEYLLNKDPNVALYKSPSGDTSLHALLRHRSDTLGLDNSSILQILHILQIIHQLDPPLLNQEDWMGLTISSYICKKYSDNAQLMDFIFTHNLVTERDISTLLINGSNFGLDYCLQQPGDRVFRLLSTPTLIQDTPNNCIPIHVALKSYCPIDSIIKLVDYMYAHDPSSLEIANSNGWRVCHYVCRYYSNDLPLIKHIFSKNINLEAETNTGWRPIHLLCRHGSLETIEYIIGYGLNLTSAIRRYNSMNQELLPNDLIERNNQLDTNSKDGLISQLLQFIMIQDMESGLRGVV